MSQNDFWTPYPRGQPVEDAPDLRAFKVAKRWLLLPAMLYVLRDGTVRRHVPRPETWTDADVETLREVWGRNPFPAPPSEELVDRVVPEARIEQIFAGKAPAEPTPPKAPNPAVERVESVRRTIDQMAAAEKARKPLLPDPPEPDWEDDRGPGYFDALARSAD